MSNLTSEFVEQECKRLAQELLVTGRALNPDELAYWMTFVAGRGYDAGFVAGSENKPFNRPSSNHVPKL